LKIPFWKNKSKYSIRFFNMQNTFLSRNVFCKILVSKLLRWYGSHCRWISNVHVKVLYFQRVHNVITLYLTLCTWFLHGFFENKFDFLGWFVFNFKTMMFHPWWPYFNFDLTFVINFIMACYEIEQIKIIIYAYKSCNIIINVIC
jgi:hypothetical protein